MDGPNQKPDRPEPWERADAAPSPPETPVVFEPWMTLHPAVTLQQWQAYRARMSPAEWEAYCNQWRVYHSASQTPQMPQYGQPSQPYAAPYGGPPPIGQPYPAYPAYPAYQPKPSKIKPFMLAIWPPIAYIGSQVMAGIVIAVVVVAALMLDDPYSLSFAYEDALDNMIGIAMYLSVALQVVFVPIFMFCFLRDRKRAAQEGVSLTDGPSAPPLAVTGVLAAAGLYFVISSLLQMLENVIPTSWMEEYGEVMENVMGDMGLLSFISVVILAPVVEELCMRGLVQRRLMKLMPEWSAVFVASAIFGIIHMNLIQGLYAFALGLIFGWMYLRGRNIAIPILAHLVFNGMNYVVNILIALFEEDLLRAGMLNAMGETTPLYAGVSAVSGLVLAGLMMMLYAFLSRKRKSDPALL